MENLMPKKPPRRDPIIVYKREDKTDILLATWDSIAKASRAECISTSKLSRFIKHKDIIDDYYYSII